MKRTSTAALLTLMLCVGCEVKPTSTPKPPAIVIVEESHSSSVNDVEPPQPDVAPIEQHPADDAVVQLTAREFYDEKKKDPKGTLAKYAGRWVEISGTYFGVRAVPRENGPGEMLVVTMFPSGAGLKTDVISCHMQSNEHPWKEAAVNDEIVMRGLVRIFGDNIYLAECEISQPGQAGLNVDIGKFIELAKADWNAFSNQHRDKQLVVSGKFAGLMPPPTSESGKCVAIDGSNGDRIFASYVGLGADFSKLKIGVPVTVIGRLNSYPATDDPLQKEAVIIDAQCLNSFAKE